VYGVQRLNIASMRKRVLAICEAPGPVFYALAFCVTYLIATMFFDIRILTAQIIHLKRH
jgi:hypothetical protein